MLDEGFIGLRTDFAGVKYKCVTCENEMTESRRFAFTICDKCIDAIKKKIFNSTERKHGHFEYKRTDKA